MQLELYQEYFSDWRPILYSQKDKDDNLFLCLEYARRNGISQTIVTKTTPSILIDMLTDIITIREAVFRPGCKVYHKCDNLAEPTSEKRLIQRGVLAPLAGEFLGAEEGEFTDFIEDLRIFNRKGDTITC